MRAILRKGLRRILGPESSRYTRGYRRATVIAVSSHKGGVGKTTTSVSLGAALARAGHTTLIIDLDPQGHVELALKKHVSGRGRRLSDILLAGDDSDVLDAVARTDLPGLKLTNADRGLAEAESLMATKIGKEFLLRDAMEITRTHFDVILLDCPPNLGTLTLNALCAADCVLVPCDASPLAIQGVNAITDTVLTINRRLGRSLDLLGIVLTRIDGRNTTVNRQAEAELSQSFGDYLCETTIGVNTAIAKAQFEGQSIFAHSPDSRGAAQYGELALELAQRLGLAKANLAA